MPDTVEAAVVLLLTVVPGYLARMTWARGKTFQPASSDFTIAIQSIAASVAVQFLMAPITIPLFLYVNAQWEKHLWALVLWLAGTGVVAVAAGAVFGWLTDRIQEKVRRERAKAQAGRTPWFIRLAVRLMPTFPTLWDHAHFDDLIPDLCLIVVEFTDGRRLAGAFGGKSLATTSPQPHGIFLEQEWSVGEDGIPTEAIRHSGGLLISEMGDVRSLHMFVPAEV